LSFGMVGTLQLALPSLPEQEAIAEVLECWDKAIRGYERKIEKKRNIKKGLMQRLLSGKLRLPGFDGEWKEARLGKVVAINKGQQLSRVDQTESGDYPVLNGGVQPLGYTDNWNTEANTITISEGGNSCGFVSFNRARFWCGGHCYAVEENASLVDKAFLYQLLKHKEVSIMRLRVGSGLPNIQKKTLERFLLLLPAPAEQQAIAAVLSSADAEIAALERKLAVLRDQKRFLLNNMVTGTIRLPQFVSSGAADVTTGDTE
jgi:type I restriction enzyme S subunit